jgi:AcrR family transcriptional regulator
MAAAEDLCGVPVAGASDRMIRVSSHARNADPPSRAPVTEQAVREAALTLFAQRGYHGTALRDIAAEVGIRTPSLYNHIDSKQELLRGILRETTELVWSDFLATVAQADDVVERLRRAVVAYAQRHATHRREALIVNRDIASLDEPARSEVMEVRRRHEQAIRQIIVEGVAQGAFEVQTPFLASFGILEMCVSIARWFDPSGPLRAEEIAGEYGEFALRLVGARRR